MEVSRLARPPITRAVKPGLAKGKVTRQPLAGISNTAQLTNVAKKASFKEKPQLKKPVKPAKKQSVEKFEEVPPLLVEEFQAFSVSHLPLDVEDIDKDDESNPQLVSHYVNDIYRYLRLLEMKFPVKKNYLESQSEVTSKMRAVLIDWLVQVHLKFHLLQETLYLTVSIIDRFLQVEKVRRSKLQLIGVTAMFIASKYEEMYAPEVGDFVYITDNTYDKSEILSMEIIILRKLDFYLGKPLPLHFLRRNSKAGDVDSTMHTLAKYLMELLLVEYDFVQYCPSIIAAAALYVAIKLIGNKEWTPTLAYYSGYNESEILPLVSSICKLILTLPSKKLKAIPHKYASVKMMKISLIPELSSPMVKTLAERCGSLAN